MSLTEKIRPLALGVGLGAITLAGCSITPTTPTTTKQVETGSYEVIENAMQVLGVRNATMISHLPNGYITLKNIAARLRTLAGVYAGTVKVIQIKDGYVAQGSYSEFENPEALERVVKEADTNNDKIVTFQEANVLARKLYEQYAK